MTEPAVLVQGLPGPYLASARQAERLRRPFGVDTPAAETSLALLLMPLWWHRWLMAAIVLAATAISAALAFTAERQFVAVAKLAVLSAPVDSGQNPLGAAERPRRLDDQIEYLTSRPLAQRLVDTLDLQVDSEFVPPQVAGGGFVARLGDWFLRRAEAVTWLEPLTDGLNGLRPTTAPSDDARRVLANEKAIEAFDERLQVSPQGTSSILAVAFRSNDPLKAATIANRVVEQFIAEQTAERRSDVEQAAAHLQDRAAMLRDELRTAEDAITAYLRRSGLSGEAAADQRLAVLQQRLLDNAAARATQARKVERLTRIMAQGEIAALVAELEDSLAVQRLLDEETGLRQQITQLSATLGERHPELVALRNEAEAVRGRLRTELTRRVALERDELALLDDERRTLVELLESLEGRAVDASEARLELAELERRAAASRALYEEFLRGSMATSARLSMVDPGVRLVQSAAVPTRPSSPNVKVMLVIGGIAGLLLGAAAAHLVEHRANTFRSPRDVEASTGLATLALMPRIPAGRRYPRPLDYLRDRPLSLPAERLKGLLVATLGETAPIGSSRVVMVTSSLPGEGKSTVALGLATLAAASGLRTLFLDADMRRSLFSVDPGMEARWGLVDLATEPGRGTGRLLLDPRTRLRILTELAGPEIDPQRILQSTVMADVLTALRTRFELVVVDTPPVLAVSDAQSLAPMVDAAVLVARLGKTRRDELLDVLGRLDLARAPLIGTVLQDATTPGNSASAYYTA
jgi:capsular exopolysaccharide synthesis family protein